jgi:hypothetical protein
MTEQQSMQRSHEHHSWEDLTPEQLLATLPYEIYAPVSVLGSDLDRLLRGEFEDEDELNVILLHLRETTNQLSRVVVALKNYTKNHPIPAESDIIT